MQWVDISNLLFGNQYVLFVMYLHKDRFPKVHFCPFSTRFQYIVLVGRKAFRTTIQYISNCVQV